MLETVPDILARIVDHKRGERAGRSVDVPAMERSAAEAAASKRGFRATAFHHPRDQESFSE
jgi:hypothetical protein